jgi:hypothetical protein
MPCDARWTMRRPRPRRPPQQRRRCEDARSVQFLDKSRNGMASRFPADEGNRASPPHRPREDGLTHPADTPRSNLASASGLEVAAFRTLDSGASWVLTGLCCWGYTQAKAEAAARGPGTLTAVSGRGGGAGGGDNKLGVWNQHRDAVSTTPMLSSSMCGGRTALARRHKAAPPTDGEGGWFR